MRAILTYHSVDPSGSPISIEAGVLRRHLEWLASGRLQVVSVEQVLSLPAESSGVALTFDDGFSNFATEAAPLLREHGFPATLFVVTGHVGGDNRWRGRGDPGIPVLPLLDWDDLGKLREAGVSLGAHTRTHPRLTRLEGPMLEAELADAADEMKRRLGVPPEGLAYPYGVVNDQVARAAAACYQWACTTELKPLGTSESRHRLPRLDARYLSGARLANWGTPGFRAWLWCRRQGRRLRVSLAPVPGR